MYQNIKFYLFAALSALVLNNKILAQNLESIKLDTSKIHYQSHTAPWLISKEDRSLASNPQIDAFIGDLMSKMTLREKIGQLNLASVGFDVTGPLLSQGVEEKIDQGLIGGVFNTFTPVAVRKLQERAVKNSRLHIPLLMGYDVIHGHRTIFPIPLGLSCTWNPQLIESTAAIAAKEASADGLNWTFSPMVDIARDPRWGRVSEGAGEDPYLGSIIAKSMVQGYQGSSLKDPNRILACVKHFALYGAPEAGRDYNTVDMSTYKMFNDYLPPYQASINSGVATVMTSFNDINGTPATCNDFMLQNILRKSWGFDGMVVTDYTAINEMVNHGIGNEIEVSRRAIKAGAEMDMVGELYLNHLEKVVAGDSTYVAYINTACENILKAKYRLGLFEDPYRGLQDDNSKVLLSKEFRDVSRKAAEESFVLLKNEGVLPLNSTQKIAYIGPQIKRKRDLIGNWSGAGDWNQAVSIWDAVKNNKGTSYALGCELLESQNLIDQLQPHGANLEKSEYSANQLIKEAIKVAKKSDVIVLALGEAFGMSGEAASMSQIQLPNNQVTLLQELRKLNKPIVLILFNGRPMVLGPILASTNAILECWFPGTEGGHAIANTLFGMNNPSGRLTMTFPRNEGQIPIYYNAKNTGRPFDKDQKYTSKYLDASNQPEFPFGFGLSYSKFEYGTPRLSFDANTVTISITIQNTSKIAGDETVQCYFRDVEASYTRPLKQLIRFQKINILPNERKEVTFEIPIKELGFYTPDGIWIVEKGRFEFFVGNNSTDNQKMNFELK